MPMTHPQPARRAMASILLVDDDTHDRVLFCAVARKTAPSLRVHTSCHGQDATEFLEGRGRHVDRRRYPLPGVILLDLKMPVMDGFEFLAWRRVRPLVRAIPVVAFSGWAEEGLERRARALGAGQFHPKGFGIESWSALVREAVKLVGVSSCTEARPELSDPGRAGLRTA